MKPGLSDILVNLIQDIQKYESKLDQINLVIKDYTYYSIENLKDYIDELRLYRRKLQEEENLKNCNKQLN